MQLAKNTITKTLNEKLKYKDFKNINNLLSDEEIGRASCRERV